jgi:thiol:disulfide interchange protein
MSSTPRLRVVGLAAGLAVLALAAGFFLLSRGQDSSTAATTHAIVPLSKRSTPKVTKHAAKPAARKPVARKPAARKRAVAKPAANADGLPSALAAALANHRVVVVALYAPKVELDDMALREAQAGAAASGAGFVALDVLNESQSKPLTKKLGVLEDPAVLVFRRPSEVVVHLSGFADKQTVAQAARNAGL